MPKPTSSRPSNPQSGGSQTPAGTGDSTAADLLSKFAADIDWDGLGVDAAKQQIRAAAGDPEDDPWPSVRVRNVNRADGFLMGWNAAVRLQIESPLGNHAMAYSTVGEARVIGDVGHSAGDGLDGGVIRVRGNAGDGVGVAMKGGTIAIYGSAGNRAAASMRGGGVFVRGNVGDDCGYGAIGGLIVVGGSAGERLGLAAQNVSIFIRGDVGSLADGMTEAPLRKRELLRLGMVLINASIRGEAKEFRRIVPVETLDQEKQSRREVNPSWR